MRSPERNRWIHDLYWCADCGTHVPVFRDLARPEQAILDGWLAQDNRPRAAEIARVTGLEYGVAKAWVHHMNQTPPAKGRWNTASCPQCGRWLRTPTARQCLHCGADWH